MYNAAAYYAYVVYKLTNCNIFSSLGRLGPFIEAQNSAIFLSLKSKDFLGIPLDID